MVEELREHLMERKCIVGDDSNNELFYVEVCSHDS